MAGATEKYNLGTSIDWSDFLSRHDLHWTQMPTKWYETPFLGNGMMGTMVRQIDDHSVRWDVGRGDVQDHRPGGGMYSTCRLPIGYFLLKTAGTIKDGTMKLDLWNAEATGEIQTDKGSIGWLSIVHAERMVILTVLEPSEGERGCRWEWKSLEAISPRHASGRKQEGYKNNPPAVITKDGDTNVCIQPLLAGGETATAWIVDKQKDKSVLMVSVAHSFPETTARQEAVDVLYSTRDVPMDKLMESHRRWWHNYYPNSFVSIPDTEWESFYWIQIYKLASATRADGMLIDNQGPWLQPTPWPGAWWNLNVQLTYWPIYDSNRLGLGNSLCRTLYTNVKTLIDNVPEEYRSDSAGISRATGQHCRGGVGAPDGENAPEIGLLLWACHNCWLHYRHSMDDETLRNDLFPLLRRAVNYHLHFVTKDKNATLHLPKTYSPEYNYNQGPDCNFDLALLRWGCTTLVKICEQLDIDDPLLPKWQNTIKNLTDYPINENGYMIARGVPFARKHRHYSHLLMLYPLYLVNVEQAGAKERAVKSVQHWQSFGKSTGYAMTGASSISAAFGLGNDALEYLNGLKSFLQPNTLYFEGPGWPVIETPLSGAQCIHDMIIQSWGDTIRVFPAAPDAWGDIVFDDLRTQGAFLVSARRTKGKTQFVRIKSLAGEPCTIMPGLDGKVQVFGSRRFNLKELKPGLFELDIKKGEEAILFSGDKMPDLKITPVPAEKSKCNSFGLNFPAETAKMSPFVIEEALDIAEVPSGFPVRFCLLTAGKHQYVGYYDKDHRMTIASRNLDSNKWQYQVLPSKVGWDSHNYITMAVDREGHLHVAGDMHCVKLIYFRTDKPGDITTLKKYAMTSEAEDKVTYPKFLTDKQGELIFNYRDGSSGNGRRIYNKYNRNTRSWSRLMDKPLLDGEGKRNAYPMGPVRGPNGWYHIVWVWRDTPDCATNHHLSYARSKDLIHWESASGEKVELPMTSGNMSLCVDPIESGGGIINGCQKLIFDTDNRPIITYHKSDTNGNMQIYATRFEDGNWMPHQLTDWSKPVKFSGYGSMGFIGIKISELIRVAPGTLTMTYRHRDYGSGRLVIDEKTLRPISKEITIPRGYPEEMIRPRIDFKGIEIQRTGDIGTSGEEGIHYVLQWETLGRNFDRPRKPPLPKPSMLSLYKLSVRD
jgi:hypothetical protein